LLIPGISLHAQKVQEATPDTSGMQNYKEQIKRLMGFLEFSLNTLGDPETTTKEKEIIINESYSKAFLTDKVQIEDDLDENREILTYKDVQAYLKDVDFFFEKAEFNYEIQDIQSLTNTEGMRYFKVTANRNLKGETVEKEQVSNNKTRYIEINLDDEEQVLKIASIYTTKLNESEELMAWWNGMPQTWKDVLGKEYVLMDTIRLSQVDFQNDSTLLLINYIPETMQRESYIMIGNDSLFTLITDTILTKSAVPYPVSKGTGYRALREIVRLEDLDVAGNLFITDLYPLNQMSDLRSLDISNTLVSDLFPVRYLTKLVTMNLSNTDVADLGPLQYNTKVREIYFDSTLVHSLEPLAGFQELEIMHSSGTYIEDLTHLKGMALLKDLDLDNTPVSDLGPLADIPSLEVLSLSGSQVTTLEPIQYLVSLRKISINNTGIDSLAYLSRLENLQTIYADQTGITDLSPLGGIPALEKVYCDQTGVTRAHANAFMAEHPGVLVIYESQGLNDWWNSLNLDWQQVFRDYVRLDPVPTKEQLHKVTLIDTLDITGKKNITTLEPLSILTNLEVILAGGTYVSDLKPLQDLTDLVVLDFSGTRITSLVPLKSLSRLEELDVADTPVDSLGGLNALKNLRTLTIDRTNVGDLEPLKPISSVKIVYCDNTKVGKLDIDRFLDIHPGTLVVYQTTLLKPWWEGLSAPWKQAFRDHSTVDDPPTREQLHAVVLLTSLDLSGKRDLLSLEPLKALARLEDVNLANGSLQDVTPLADLVRLKKLNLSGNPLTDLSPFAALPHLQILDISNTPVSKLDALETLNSLEQLNCSGTQIKKLDPLAGLSNLKKLECQNTEINNLKPLTQLFQLKNLVCYNTKLTQKKVDAFKELIPGVEVVFY
jgi:Leucine-rich repeat (LRR) protein